MRAASCLLLVALLLTGARSGLCGQAPTSKEPEVSREESKLLAAVTELAATDLPAAIEKLRAATGEKSSAALDFALGVLLSRAERHAEAEKAYAAAVGKLPEFTRAWEALGRVRLVRERPAKAAEAFLRVMEQRGPSAEVWKLLGYSYLLAERPLAAETAYRQAVALAPDDREVKLGLARTLLAGERHAEVLPLLKRLCAEDPLRDEFWLLAADAHLALERPDRALILLESTRRLGGLEPGALATLGDLYYNAGLHDLAVERYDAAIASGRLTARRTLRCAEALFAAGRAEDASRYLAKARELGLEEPARGHLLAGRIAEASSDFKAAGRAFDKALEAEPLNGEALLARGRLHWRAKEHEQARIVLERAARVPGFEARAVLVLAQLEVELDRFEKAIEHLEFVQELDPSPRVGRYLEQIRRLARLTGAG